MTKNKKVCFTNLSPLADRRKKIDDAISDVVSSGKYLFGEQSKCFESEFCNWLGDDFGAVTVGNAHDALHIIMRSMGVGHGHEVILPANAPIPVWTAIAATGAKPIPCDVNKDTYQMNVYLAMQLIRPNTAAIMVVHLYGIPANIRKIIKEISKGGEKYSSIGIIEDCSQAHGATIESEIADEYEKVGTIGDISAFSFYPTKNLGAMGDAGIIVSRNQRLLNKCRSMRFYGEGKMFGVNSRMDEIQAAILREKLSYLDQDNMIRKSNAKEYFRLLSGSHVGLPKNYDGSVWHQFVITSKKRDELREFLFANGIETMVHYPIICQDESYFNNRYGPYNKSPVAEELSRTVLSLPIAPHVTHEDIAYICEKIRKFGD